MFYSKLDDRHTRGGRISLTSYFVLENGIDTFKFTTFVALYRILDTCRGCKSCNSSKVRFFVVERIQKYMTRSCSWTMVCCINFHFTNAFPPNCTRFKWNKNVFCKKSAIDTAATHRSLTARVSDLRYPRYLTVLDGRAEKSPHWLEKSN